MSIPRHSMPGKTTITVLSSFIGGIRPPNLHVPPKLRNPKVALKAISSSSSQAVSIIHNTCTVEPLIKDPSRGGHNRNNLFTRDTLQVPNTHPHIDVPF